MWGLLRLTPTRLPELAIESEHTWMRLCSYMDHIKDHIKESSGIQELDLNHKNPLDDTNIMSVSETVASGLELILSRSFSLICQSQDYNIFKYFVPHD